MLKKTKPLGLIIDDNLRWNRHIHYICSKENRKIGVIGRTRGYNSKRSSVQLYRSLVDLYFRYGDTIWGFCPGGSLQLRLYEGVRPHYGKLIHPQIKAGLSINKNRPIAELCTIKYEPKLTKLQQVLLMSRKPLIPR